MVLNLARKTVAISMACFCCAAQAQNPIGAEDDLWQHCSTPFMPPNYVSRPTQSIGEETRISADSALVRQQEYFQLEGRVELQKQDYFLSADKASYHRTDDQVEASGSVHFETENFVINGDQASLNMAKNLGTINTSRFWLPGNHLRGEADNIHLQDKDAISMDKAVFTSCNEDDEVWKLRAGRLSINRAKNEAIVHHARLELFQIPVLYFPYLNLPIEGRKTGLLIPNMGYSNESGNEFAQPFYWNIAPERDATFTGHYFSNRGTQAKTEFRFLNESGGGQVNLEYLPGDRIYGDDRRYVAFNQRWLRGDPQSNWSADVQYQSASDEDYLKDFGGALDLSSLSYLERIATVSLQHQGWRAQAMAQHFQIMDAVIAEQDKPMQRLPQIQLDTPLYTLSGMNAGLQSEWVRFDRDSGLKGMRSHIKAGLDLPITNSYGFLKPGVTWRYTYYELENNQSGSDSEPSISVPAYTLDSGLFFERTTKFGKQAFVQTLEPRLFYLHVPYREQSGLLVDQLGQEQVFDSSATRLDFAQLFRDNRYMGLDRMGDTKQLSLALTTRLMSPTGKEVFSAALGQIRYFSDRKVTLPGETVQTQRWSDTLVAVSTQFGASRLSSEFAWNKDRSATIRSSVKYRYTPKNDTALGVAYRYDGGVMEQADFSLLLPMDQQWKFVTFWNYSLKDDLTLESFQGLEYNSCCWALRLLRRETIEDLIGESYDESFLLQFELKGLASVGGKTSEYFDKGYWKERD